MGSFASRAALSDHTAMAPSLADIEGMLSGGDRRSLRGVEEAISLVLADTSAFDSLFQCLFSDDEVVRMRASDALEKIARDQPVRFASYRRRLLTEIAEIDQPSVQWHLAQIFAEIELTPKQRDLCDAALD